MRQNETRSGAANGYAFSASKTRTSIAVERVLSTCLRSADVSVRRIETAHARRVVHRPGRPHARTCIEVSRARSGRSTEGRARSDEDGIERRVERRQGRVRERGDRGRAATIRPAIASNSSPFATSCSHPVEIGPIPRETKPHGGRKRRLYQAVWGAGEGEGGG